MNDATYKRMQRLLIATQTVTEEVLDALVEEAPESVPSILVTEHGADRARVLKVLAEVFRVPAVDLRNDTPNPEMVERVSPDLCMKTMALPIRHEDGHAVVAFADPENLGHIDEMQAGLGMPVRPAVTLGADIQHTFLGTGGGVSVDDLISEILADHEEVAEAEAESVGDDEPQLHVSTESEARRPIVKMLDDMIAEAVRGGAVHIYLVPAGGEEVNVRMSLRDRIVEAKGYATRLHGNVVNRLRILCDLVGKDKRVPQQGSYLTLVGGERHRLDVMIIPAGSGDAVTIYIDQPLPGDKDLNTSGTCGECTAAIKPDWNYCPSCGKEIR